MLQRGQLFEAQSTSPDDKTLWAFRYLVGVCDSKRVQRGAFATERDAGEALERALERLRRDRGAARPLTLAELVLVFRLARVNRRWGYPRDRGRAERTRIRRLLLIHEYSLAA
jgi:hypothetical protein